MLSLLITLLIIVLIFGVVWWILTMIPIPPQFAWIVRVIFAVIFLIVIVDLLLGNGGAIGSGWHFGSHCDALRSC